LRRLFCLGKLESTDNCLGVAVLDVEAECFLGVFDEPFVVKGFVDISVLRLGCFLISLCAYILMLTKRLGGGWLGAHIVGQFRGGQAGERVDSRRPPMLASGRCCFGVALMLRVIIGMLRLVRRLLNPGLPQQRVPCAGVIGLLPSPLCVGVGSPWKSAINIQFIEVKIDTYDNRRHAL
jgi:hypothetical protein